MKVLRINASDTYDIRYKMLREGRPKEEVHFENDDDDQTFHLGAFYDNKLVSVASFYFENMIIFLIKRVTLLPSKSILAR